MVVDVQEEITSLILNINFMQCRKCGINVGCSCQLINGLCKGCYAASFGIVKRIKNVISQTYRLC